MSRPAGMKKLLAAGILLALVTAARAEKPVSPERPASPIRIKFTAVRETELLLEVERDPKIWPSDTKPAGRIMPAGRLELLLRLPVGVKLESEGWKRVPLPEGEKEGSEEIWSTFEQVRPVESFPQEPSLLAKIPLQLRVVEEGTNWIITTRVRLTQDSKILTAFGTILATLQDGVVEFHTTPKHPLAGPIRQIQKRETSKPNAQTNRH
ncbi:MAG: hypothetical protein HY211_04145 [Candidatus Omnitrophica bacterium]|nr:hypothetical protein [Candidatus Omnitrophota bacterium]